MRKLLPLLLSLTLISERVSSQTQFAVEKQIFQSNPAARASGSMANTLLAMSVASLGTVMLSTCRTVSGAPLPDSVIAFSNASFSYISAEIASANQHKSDIDIRNAAVQANAARMKIQGGGEVQKIVFEEAKIERQFLLDFIGIRRMWIAALIIGFNNAATIASGEPTNPDTTLICTGTLNAARTLAAQLGSAFNAVIGPGPAEEVSDYLSGVLDIVAAQILPLSETPNGRMIVSMIAADSAVGVLGELGPQFDAIAGNIANINVVMSEFEASNGVAINTGVTAPRGKLPTLEAQESPQGTPVIAASNSSATSTVTGSGSINQVSASGSSAVNLQRKTCAEKTTDGKSLEFKEVCVSPLKFPAPIVKNEALGTKSAAESTNRLANALASGDIEAAKIAATGLSSLAALVIATRTSAVKTKNLTLLKSGKPMLDIDGDTKKAIQSMTTEITTSVKNKGGEKFLASSSPALVPEAITPQVLSQKENLTDLPPRLRGKYFVPAKKVSETAVEVKAEVVPEEEKSLWQRLTNRYQLHYDKFQEKKNP